MTTHHQQEEFESTRTDRNGFPCAVVTHTRESGAACFQPENAKPKGVAGGSGVHISLEIRLIQRHGNEGISTSAPRGTCPGKFGCCQIRKFSERFIAVSWRRRPEVRQCATKSPEEQLDGWQSQGSHSGTMASRTVVVIFPRELEASHDDRHDPNQHRRTGWHEHRRIRPEQCCHGAAHRCCGAVGRRQPRFGGYCHWRAIAAGSARSD